jgi:hypothetical protein
MEHAFQMGCREGDKVFYLFLTTWKREENTIDKHERSGMFNNKKSMTNLTLS